MKFPALGFLALAASAQGQSPARLEFHALEKELWQTCSVTEVLGNRAAQSSEATPLKCGVLVSTNCTIAYRSRCPDECPFIAPHHAFPCFFVCSAKEECATNNPDRAFPDPSVNTCRWCAVEGCRECTGSESCKTCHEGFRLTEAGQCTFRLNELPWLRGVVALLGTAAALVGLGCSLWYCAKGGHARAKQNMQSILQARRHRLRTKVQSWHLGGKPYVAHRYSIFTRINQENILGVGLPLFYNAIGFTVFAAAAYVVATCFVFHSTGAASALEYFKSTPDQLRAGAVHPMEIAPAVVVSRLTNCKSDNVGYVQRTIEDFSVRNFYALGFLYVVLFVGKLVYGLHQKRFKQSFDRHNGTMSDFALVLSGFAASCTDEGALRLWMQEQLERLVGPEVEVDGVSIMYDYVDPDLWAEVDKMKDRMLVLMEMQAYESEGPLPNLDRSKWERRKAEDSKIVHEWFDEGKMKSSGHAIVVFTHAASASRVRTELKPGTLRHNGRPISVKAMRSEPPSVNWWYAGRSHEVMQSNCIKTICKVFFGVALIQLLVVYPYTTYIVLPYSRIGSSASGLVVAVGGQVMGVVNNLLGIWTFNTCSDIGFKFKESMDTLVLFLNTTTSLVNIALNLLIMVSMVESRNLDEMGLFNVFHRNLVSVSMDNDLASNLYQFMMPGFFFTGSLMTIVMAGIWPYLLNTFLMKVIYVWRAGPDWLLRIFKHLLPGAPASLERYSYQYAEQALEPMEVQPDYGSLIVIPTVCSVMLIFVSPFTPAMFEMMLAWAIFYLGFCRYMHLRFCKTAYFTTDIIDVCFNFMWSLPLAVIGFAWCLWGIRSKFLLQGYSEDMHVVATLSCGLSAGVLFALAYQVVVRPLQRQEVEQEHNFCIDEVREHSLYDWYNCNPVYALKCYHYHQDQHGELRPERNPHGHPLAAGTLRHQVRFYAVGKEYLFVEPQEVKVALQQASYPSDILEIEYWVELLLQGADLAASLLRGSCEARLNEYSPLLQDFEDRFLATGDDEDDNDAGGIDDPKPGELEQGPGPRSE